MHAVRLVAIPFSVSLPLLVFASGCVPGGLPLPATKLTDAEITQRLVGKWNEPSSGKDFIHEFGQDGTYKGAGVTDPGVGATSGSFTGTWAVTDGVLIYTIQTSDPPIYDPGERINDRVLSLTETEFKYQGEDGKQRSMTRVSQ
jgi:hypothetical protein